MYLIYEEVGTINKKLSENNFFATLLYILIDFLVIDKQKDL